MTQIFRTAILVAALAAFPPAVNAQDVSKGMEYAQAGNFAAALLEWRPLAEQGNIEAQFNLGIMFELGNGVSKDLKEALRWYRLAADQGDAMAQYNVGVYYAQGMGVAKDFKESMRWTRLAAQQGDTLAQFNLGSMYYKGMGVSKDMVAAHMWYNIAAANGDQQAGQARDIIEKTMTPNQVVQATQKAETCLASNYANCD